MTETEASESCKACGTALSGRYCSACGQSIEDYRRSFLLLAEAYVRDAFSADSRAIRTVVDLARRPGHVPAAYMRADRTTYTPPVRLFLIVSFIFFVTLSLADTLFLAIEVRHTPPGAEQIERAGLDINDPDTAERISCSLAATGRFFVRASDVEVDQALWERCSGRITRDIEQELAGDPSGRFYSSFMNRLMIGIGRAVEDPRPLNQEANVWLGRFLVIMVPVLGLTLGLFFRGSETFLFDHMIFSLYIHAAAFILLAIGVWGVHFGASVLLGAATIAIFVYFVFALKRAYRRSWLKTGLSAGLVSLVYMIVLALGGLLIPAAILVAT